ncbi:MAG: response regulator [Candidatus Rokubacteria bacterium]|nr:response regulator [Candidatus Rokubacteria bacterium]
MLAQLERPRILIVDDDAGLCDVLAEALAGLGYRVAKPPLAEAALETLDQGVPDLVLTDVQMAELLAAGLRRRMGRDLSEFLRV